MTLALFPQLPCVLGRFRGHYDPMWAEPFRAGTAPPASVFPPGAFPSGHSPARLLLLPGPLPRPRSPSCCTIRIPRAGQAGLPEALAEPPRSRPQRLRGTFSLSLVSAEAGGALFPSSGHTSHFPEAGVHQPVPAAPHRLPPALSTLSWLGRGSGSSCPTRQVWPPLAGTERSLSQLQEMGPGSRSTEGRRTQQGWTRTKS